MKLQKYAVSSLLLLALVFSFSTTGTKVSAEDGVDTSVKAKSSVPINKLPTDDIIKRKSSTNDTTKKISVDCKFIDVDGNGKLNRDDFKAFEGLFGSLSMRADVDQNKVVNVLDSSAFLNAYAACPHLNSLGSDPVGNEGPQGPVDYDEFNSSNCKVTDIDGNGKFEVKDYELFKQYYKEKNIKADITKNGAVDTFDPTAFVNGMAYCTRGLYIRNDVKSSDDVTPRSSDDNSRSEKVKFYGSLKLSYDRLFGNLDAYLTKFTNLANLLEKRIVELNGKNVATTEAKAHLTAARTHIANAKTAIDTAKTLWKKINTASTIDSSTKVKPAVMPKVSDDPAKGGDDRDVVTSVGSAANLKAVNGQGGAKAVGGAVSINTEMSVKEIRDTYAPVKAQIEIAKKEFEAARKELMETVKALRTHDDKEGTVVPGTPLCKLIDANKDGILSAKDFGAFRAVFEKGDKVSADIDANGSLNVLDFSAFMNGYASCGGKNPDTKAFDTNPKVDSSTSVKAGTDSQ